MIARGDPEIAVLRPDPAVDDFHDIDALPAQQESERLQISMKPCAAFNLQNHRAVIYGSLAYRAARTQYGCRTYAIVFYGLNPC
jgi:hypothetical protein